MCTDRQYRQSVYRGINKFTITVYKTANFNTAVFSNTGISRIPRRSRRKTMTLSPISNITQGLRAATQD